MAAVNETALAKFLKALSHWAISSTLQEMGTKNPVMFRKLELLLVKREGICLIEDKPMHQTGSFRILLFCTPLLQQLNATHAELKSLFPYRLVAQLIKRP
jgi:hypothetical protein